MEYKSSDENVAEVANRLLRNQDFIIYQEWIKTEYEIVKQRLADHIVSLDKTEMETVNRYGGALEQIKRVLNLPEEKKRLGKEEES